jgi:hypothetical protein
MPSWMSNYSKLIGGLVGNVIAIIVVYAATRGLATCTVFNNADTCTIAGFSTSQITGFAMMVLNAVFIHWAPANTPPPSPPAAPTT